MSGRPMGYGDLLMDVMTGPPLKKRKKGFAQRVRDELAAEAKKKRKARRK